MTRVKVPGDLGDNLSLHRRPWSLGGEVLYRMTSGGNSELEPSTAMVASGKAVTGPGHSSLVSCFSRIEK